MENRIRSERTALTSPRGLVLLLVAVFALLGLSAQAASQYFTLTIIDGETKRGIPGVKVSTTNQAFYVTDSKGRVAFYRPELMGKNTYFMVESPGYFYPADWFGNRGKAFVATPDTYATITMTRRSIAERLYRVTGPGIYRDSALVGETVPTVQDTLTYPVMEQRSGESIVYNSKGFWIGNDTARPDRTTGNSKTTCATSTLPSGGGMDPDNGVFLQYIPQSGAPKAMVNLNYDIVRAGCMRVTTDNALKQTLYANYRRLDASSNVIERGLLKYNNATKLFDPIATFSSTAPVIPDGAPFQYTDGNTPYFYYATNPFPNVRSLTNDQAMGNPSLCQGLTCLVPGSTIAYNAKQISRDDKGKLRWGWAADTSPVGPKETNRLVALGLIESNEQWSTAIDMGSSRTLTLDKGTVNWNPYRQRYISLSTEDAPSSRGEVWYFEGDTPLGPWVYGQKVASHVVEGSGNAISNYSFRDIFHHPELDKANGRYVYFDGMLSIEGTSTRLALPRYNGNRLMYRLDLATMDTMPVPVYAVGATTVTYRTKTMIADPAARRVPVWFGSDHAGTGLIPIYEYPDPAHNTVVLSSSATSPTGNAGTIIFYAYSNSTTGDEMFSLNEFTNATTGNRIYTTDASVTQAGYSKTATVCRVRPNPLKFNPYDLAVIPRPNSVEQNWSLYQ